jgi:hypothetical protein
MPEFGESKAVRTVNLSLGLSDVVDEEAMIELRNENRKKSTVNLSLGLGRMNSSEESDIKHPGNPMLKIGLEIADDLEVTEPRGVGEEEEEDMLSLTDMMSALGNDSLGGEAWETKADVR